MNIYDYPQSDQLLWQRYAEFHLQFCSGSWSPGLVVRPYGTLMFGAQGDWGDLLWKACPSSGWPAKDIIKDVESLSERNLKKPCFYLNACFDKNLSIELQELLVEQNYSKKYDIDWMVLEQTLHSAPVFPEGFIIDDAKDADSYIKVLNEAFPHSSIEDFYRDQIPVHTSGVKDVRFLILSDKNNEPVATGIVAYQGEIGYLSGLGVRPKWRRQGLGKFMVDWRLHLLSQAGVKYIVTGVLADNIESQALQKQKGYRPFAKAECWIKE